MRLLLGFSLSLNCLLLVGLVFTFGSSRGGHSPRRSPQASPGAAHLEDTVQELRAVVEALKGVTADLSPPQAAVSPEETTRRQAGAQAPPGAAGNALEGKLAERITELLEVRQEERRALQELLKALEKHLEPVPTDPAQVRYWDGAQERLQLGEGALDGLKQAAARLGVVFQGIRRNLDAYLDKHPTWTELDYETILGFLKRADAGWRRYVEEIWDTIGTERVVVALQLRQAPLPVFLERRGDEVIWRAEPPFPVAPDFRPFR